MNIKYMSRMHAIGSRLTYSVVEGTPDVIAGVTNRYWATGFEFTPEPKVRWMFIVDRLILFS